MFTVPGWYSFNLRIYYTVALLLYTWNKLYHTIHLITNNDIWRIMMNNMVYEWTINIKEIAPKTTEDNHCGIAHNWPIHLIVKNIILIPNLGLNECNYSMWYVDTVAILVQSTIQIHKIQNEHCTYVPGKW